MRKTRITIILLALVLGAATSLSAQTSRTAVGVGESFTAVMTLPKDGEPKGGRLYACLASSPAPCTTRLGADAAGGAGADASVSVPAGLQATGLHRIEAAAFNDAGESVRASVTLWVGPPPAPSLPRIQVTTTQVFDQVPIESGIKLVLVSAKTESIEVK